MTTPEQINITLGTAGHVDHGKTALVKCLTGCETDRLKEEKERGMSIDLGFAPYNIAGTQIGIVDVPGHESFVKTMVAGASGMDGVILVVAADDGIMPQTREHLDILTLLGLRHGLVALTKIDRVEPERRAAVAAELSAYLHGTFLQGAPILPLSNVTGEGYDPFLEALDALVTRIVPRRVDGVFRLPLDRAFSAHGYGTVVAGIPVSGSAAVGDEVVLLPAAHTGRLRRIEVYGRDAPRVLAGQCAAINVGHWDHRGIHRGDVLTLPGYFSANEWYACTLRLLPLEKLLLKSGGEVKFHTGTSDVPAAIYPVGSEPLESCRETIVQLHLKTPVVAGPGDRFILRSLSPVRTIGGGAIIEATPRRLKRNRPEIYAGWAEHAAAVADERRLVEYCVRAAPAPAVTENELALRAGLLRARVQAILAELVSAGQILALAPGLHLHRDTAEKLCLRLLDVVGEYHRARPESPGMTPEELRQAAALDKPVWERVLALAKAGGRLVERSGRLALAGHQPALADEEARRMAAMEELLRAQPFHPPSAAEIAQQTGQPLPAVEKALRILCEHQRAVRVEPELLFHREAVDRAKEILVAHLVKEGRLESVQFKYLLDTSRKFALALLDYFDRTGLLRRTGNTRFLKTPPGK